MSDRILDAAYAAATAPGRDPLFKVQLRARRGDTGAIHDLGNRYVAQLVVKKGYSSGFASRVFLCWSGGYHGDPAPRFRGNWSAPLADAHRAGRIDRLAVDRICPRATGEDL